MTLHQLADELKELIRYVRTHPEYVRREINRLGVTSHIDPKEGDVRLYKNVHVGLHFLPCDPELLEGYLYNAAFEVRCEARRQEKEREKK